MSRLLLILVAVPLVLILAAAILIPVLLDKDKILAMAAAEVKKHSGADLVVAGDVDLSLFPTLGVTLGEVTLDMPAEDQPSLAVRQLQIGVQVMPLLSREIAVDTLALDGFELKLVTEPAPAPVDTSEFSEEQLREFYARRREAMEAAGQSAQGAAALAVPLALNVARLSITDSRVAMQERGGDTSVITIRRLVGSDLNLDGRPINLEGEVRMEGEDPVDLAFKGDITVDQDSQLLDLQALGLTITGALADAVEVQTSGQVDINQQVADLNLVADIADTRAEGQVRYAAFESPRIDAQLKLNLFTPALLALAGPDAAAAEAGADSGTEEGDVALPVEAIRQMDTRARLDIARVDWGAHTVTDLEARLRVVDGAANLHKVTGTVHGGQLDMKANLNAKFPEPRINTQGSLRGVDIASVLQAAKAQPVMTGSVDLDWKLNGRGATSNAISRSLRGPITLVARDAVLREMGVEQMMCEAIALVNQESLAASFPSESAFQALSADVNLGDGQARLQPLRAELGAIGLKGTGALDIQSLDFDTTFEATVSPGLEQLDPACRVNERITAIDWPVNCKGNVSGEPGDWCAVDTAEIIQDLAGNELKRKAEKEVEKKLGKEAGDALKKLFGN